VIITRSPLRITLGGGGTDLPSYYRDHEGFLIAAAIDKYVYITLHETFAPGLIIKYSQLEAVERVADVKHPIIRECLDFVGIEDPRLELASMSDIPAGTGLGSSGSFTTALLKALHTHKKHLIHPHELADQALEIDPDSAQPWVVKAGNYANMAESGVLPREEGYELAREAADRALAINPEQAGAHSAVAWMAMYYLNDRVLAARHFERAIELDPSDLGVLSNSAVLLLKLHRFGAAIAVQEYVVSRDPLSAIAHFNLGEMYFAARRFDDAAGAFRAMLEMSPEFRGGQLWLSKALLKGGHAASACEAARRETFEPFRKLGLALCAYGLGDFEEADAALVWIMEKGEKAFPYDIASVWAYRENGEQTAEWVSKAIAYDDNDIGDPAMDPLFEYMLDDPRWLNLMKALGKTPAQLDSIKFNIVPPD